MKSFTKSESKALIIIFLILIAVSIPNFIISLRRARDQVRKDDMGALQTVLGVYFAEFREFPLASPDGRIMACKRPEDKVDVDKMGKLVVDYIPCEWGKDGIIDLTPGSSKVYMPLLPREPNFEKGAAYKYLSDGQHMQILVSLEGKDEPENDERIIARNIICGNLICNAGRHDGCSTDKSFEQCALERLQKAEIEQAM